MRTLTVATILVVAGAASAQSLFDEVGDAGHAGPGDAQQTDGVGELTQINGFLDIGDADVYAIRIVDEAAFSATTVGGAGFDTQLFLLNADGSGQVENDDEFDTFSLQSIIRSDGVFDTGLYYLGVSSFDTDPVDIDGNRLFGFDTWPGAGDQRSPIGVNLWVDFASDPSGGGGDYSIFLTGAEFAVPTPGTLAILGIAGIAATRRRR